jgi:hypothetical protein
MDRKRRALREAPKPGGGQMAENGIRSRSKDGPKAFAVKRETSMPNREHTTVKPVQVPVSHRSIDGFARVAQRPGQLTNRDNPVLALREIRKASMSPKVRRSFVPHSAPKGPADLFSPPTGAPPAALSAKKPPASGGAGGFGNFAGLGVRPWRLPGRTGSARRPGPWRPGRGRLRPGAAAGLLWRSPGAGSGWCPRIAA